MTSNRLDSQCTVEFSHNLPSTGVFVNDPNATRARVKCDARYFQGQDDCKHSLFVSDAILSSGQTRLHLFAVHEIGTHLVRCNNEEIQPWLNRHKKWGMDRNARLIKATEEGLAMVHEAMHIPSLLLARPALFYYASARAAELSFVELFEDLEQYVSNVDERFRICSLVNRGVRDTSIPFGGANGQVQVYFEGAVRILEQAHTVDLTLLFCGKLTLDDMKMTRVQRVVRREGVLLPEFARDLGQYRQRMIAVAKANGITPNVGALHEKKLQRAKIYATNSLLGAFRQAQLREYKNMSK